MTLRHNRFLNVHAINQILARVETVVRGYNNGVEDLPQLRTVIAQIRRIRRFLPRTQYGELMRGLRLLSSQLTSRSLPGRYRSSLLRVSKCTHAAIEVRIRENELNCL